MPELVLKGKILNKLDMILALLEHQWGESQRIKESHDNITNTTRISVIKKVHSLNRHFSK